jgi:NAD dependent epimerase/dehydratase family enzyme
MPWIHIADETDAIRFLAENPVEGPVNATAPNPVTNLELVRELGRILDRPSLVRAPAFAIKAALGREMAEELLLTSQRVAPAKLLAAGFEFRYPTLELALRDLLRR